MKKILSPQALSLDGILLLIRVAIGTLMLVHGIPKLGMLLSGDAVSFPAVFGLSPEFSLFLAVFAEVVCSVLILFGLGTRLAVIPLIITMLIAVFLIHLGDPFSAKELGIHYLLVYLALLFTGSGRYSVDNLVLAKVKG